MHPAPAPRWVWAGPHLLSQRPSSVLKFCTVNTRECPLSRRVLLPGQNRRTDNDFQYISHCSFCTSTRATPATGHLRLSETRGQEMPRQGSPSHLAGLFSYRSPILLTHGTPSQYTASWEEGKGQDRITGPLTSRRHMSGDVFQVDCTAISPYQPLTPG